MLTKAKQETAVGQGLAVGCLALGVTAVTSKKMSVEMAFIRAWRDWPQARHFPTIRADLERNDILPIIHDSPRRRGGYIAEWAVGRTLEPLLRGDWDVDEAGAQLEIASDVPLEGWIELARAFTDDLDQNELIRSR
ncbi:MAG: hypothetical protein ABI831_19625 [Betaproteobacteria bacterium]